MSSTDTILCPSANPQWAGARVFAVVGGTPEQPSAAYLEQALPYGAEIDALAAPVSAAEVFRMAAPCARGDCGHFDAGGDRCRLADKTVRLAPVVVHALPRCAVRADCRWWRQEGAAACRRCPQVATLNYAASPAMRSAADPLQR